jgi:hypothetical protein
MGLYSVSYYLHHTLSNKIPNKITRTYDLIGAHATSKRSSRYRQGTRDLFQTVKVRGWRRNGGASINAGGSRHHIAKIKLYKETDRGVVFGQKLMDTFAGINTGVEMPVIDRHDEAWHCSLSQMLLPREREYVCKKMEVTTKPEALICVFCRVQVLSRRAPRKK